MPTTTTAQQQQQRGSSYNQESCASSSRQVPWTRAYSNRSGIPGYRSTHSVGGIPFYVRGQTPNYPPSFAGSKLLLGAKDEVDSDIAAGLGGFGAWCTHSDLPPQCGSDTACATGYRCHSIGKICVKTDLQRCYVHSDCQGEKMCTGTGRCVTPVTEVRNEMPDMDAEFRIYAKSCLSASPAEMLSVDTYGASPWGRVPDVLRAHGFCSHRNWYEYNETMSNSDSGSCLRNQFCELDVKAFKNSWRYTNNVPRENSNMLASGLFDQGVLKQESHTCDRDYMHLADMRSCSPVAASTYWMSLAAGSAIVTPNSLDQANTYLVQNKLVRPYRRIANANIASQLDVTVKVWLRVQVCAVCACVCVSPACCPRALI